METKALPVRPEPEVVYQSWDPPSGAFCLYIEKETRSGEWERVTWGMYDDCLDRGPGRSPEARARVIVLVDGKEELILAKRQALRLAEATGQPTRVVREQGLL